MPGLRVLPNSQQNRFLYMKEKRRQLATGRRGQFGSGFASSARTFTVNQLKDLGKAILPGVEEFTHRKTNNLLDYGFDQGNIANKLVNNAFGNNAMLKRVAKLALPTAHKLSKKKAGQYITKGFNAARQQLGRGQGRSQRSLYLPYQGKAKLTKMFQDMERRENAYLKLKRARNLKGKGQRGGFLPLPLLTPLITKQLGFGRKKKRRRRNQKGGFLPLLALAAPFVAKQIGLGRKRKRRQTGGFINPMAIVSHLANPTPTFGQIIGKSLFQSGGQRGGALASLGSVLGPMAMATEKSMLPSLGKAAAKAAIGTGASFGIRALVQKLQKGGTALPYGNRAFFPPPFYQMGRGRPKIKPQPAVAVLPAPAPTSAVVVPTSSKKTAVVVPAAPPPLVPIESGKKAKWWQNLLNRPTVIKMLDKGIETASNAAIDRIFGSGGSTTGSVSTTRTVPTADLIML